MCFLVSWDTSHASLPCGTPLALCSSDEKCLIPSGEIREDYSNCAGPDFQSQKLILFSPLCVLQPQVCQKTLGSGCRVAFTLHFPKYSRSMKAANTGWRMSSQRQGEVVALGSASSLPGQELRAHNTTQFEGQMFSLTCTMKIRVQTEYRVTEYKLVVLLRMPVLLFLHLFLGLILHGLG